MPPNSVLWQILKARRGPAVDLAQVRYSGRYYPDDPKIAGGLLVRPRRRPVYRWCARSQSYVVVGYETVFEVM